MRTLHSEWVALTTTRALVGHLAVAAVLGLLPLLVIPAVDAAGDSPGVPDFSAADGQATLIASSQFAFLLAAILAAVVATRRHRHRTIVPQLLVSPHRVRTMLAQTSVLVAAGLLIGAVAVAVSTAAVALGLPLVDASFEVSSATLVRLAGTALLAGVVGAGVGVGVGALVRNSGAAIAIVVVVIFIVEPLIAGFLADVGQWLPGTLLSRVELGDSEFVTGDVAVGLAVALLLVYAVVTAGIGLVATARRDAV